MPKQSSSFWLSPQGLAALGMIGAVSYFLFMEHREHVWQYLPFLIFLLCPLMHIFMHRGHGHGGHGHSPTDSSEGNPSYQEGYEEGLKAAKKDDHKLNKE